MVKTLSKRPVARVRRSIIVVAALVAAVVAGLWATGNWPGGSTSNNSVVAGSAGEILSPLQILSGDKTHEFQVELADTDGERAQGLMFRRSLGPDRGMLFNFDVERPVSMWMRNTYIPLDMVFAKSDGTITRIASQTTPHSEDLISSGGPVKYVLELPGGTAQKLGLAPGDRLRHAAIP